MASYELIETGGTDASRSPARPGLCCDCLERLLILCFSGSFLAAGAWCLWTGALLHVDGRVDTKEMIHVWTMIVLGFTLSLAVMFSMLPLLCGEDELMTFIWSVFAETETGEPERYLGERRWYFDMFVDLDPWYEYSIVKLIFDYWEAYGQLMRYIWRVFELALVVYPWWWFCRITVFSKTDFSKQVDERWMAWPNNVITPIGITAILWIVVESLGQHLLVCRWAARSLTQAIEKGDKQQLSSVDWDDLLARLLLIKCHIESLWNSTTVWLQWIAWLVVAASIAMLGAIVVLNTDYSEEQRKCKLMGWSYLALGVVIFLPLMWVLGRVAALFYHPSSLDRSVSAAAHDFSGTRAFLATPRTVSIVPGAVAVAPGPGDYEAHQDFPAHIAFTKFTTFVDRNVVGVRFCGKLVTPKFVSSLLRMLVFYTPGGILLLDNTLLKHLGQHAHSEPGCCPTVGKATLFDGALAGGLGACEKKCLSNSACGHYSYGWDDGKRCILSSAKMRCEPQICDGSGASDVRTYWREFETAPANLTETQI